MQENTWKASTNQRRQSVPLLLTANTKRVFADTKKVSYKEFSLFKKKYYNQLF